MSVVYFSKDETGRGYAWWHVSDNSPGVFACGINLAAYHNDPNVNARFAELVAATTAYLRRTQTAEVVAPTSRLAEPCASCSSIEAGELRHRAGQVADIAELPTSPGGHLLGCCKVRVAGGISSVPAASQPSPFSRR
jgi:hypothetical protein